MTSPAVAVTGAGGRLGRALLETLDARGQPASSWTRPDYDLDDPGAATRIVGRSEPRLVVHCAAWTDVDACAARPELAMRRNGTAAGELAAECARRGIGMVFVSTNEVFDGRRRDGRGYVESDPAEPINPYGASKQAGEQLARQAFADAGRAHLLWIVRTAWLFGPPGADFPAKILAQADALTDGTPLRVVDDEFGSPTYARDLAPALLDLAATAPAGVYHLAGSGQASRYDVASAVLKTCRPGVAIKPISTDQFERPSRPPAWGVLDSSRAAQHGVRLRDWPAALDDYLAALC